MSHHDAGLAAQIPARVAMQEHSRRTLPRYLGLGTVTIFLLGTSTLVLQSQPNPLLKWEQAEAFALKAASMPQCHIFSRSMALQKTSRHCRRQAVTATNLMPVPAFPGHALRQTQFLKQSGLLVMPLTFAQFRNRVTFHWGKPSQLRRLLCQY